MTKPMTVLLPALILKYVTDINIYIYIYIYMLYIIMGLLDTV